MSSPFANFGGRHYFANDTVDLRPQNLRLVILGDSVSRYQYVSLVYYLLNNRWIQDEDDRHLLFKKYYKDWNDYLNASTLALAPNEVCDCNGPPNKPRLPRYGENRYFADPRRGNYITFLNKYGGKSVKGFRPIESVYDQPYGMEDQSQSKDAWVWEYDWTGVILNHIAKLNPKPEYLVVNAGLHPNDLGNKTVVQEMLSALNATGIIGIYKTTTYPNGSTPTSRFRRASHDRGCVSQFPYSLDMKWTRDYNKDEHYYDENHFKPHINTLMNEQLLDLIQNISGD